MPTTVLIAAIAWTAVGFIVLWANPRRFAHQVFALVGVLGGLWCACVYVGMRLQDTGAAIVAARWFIADNIVAALLIWANWMLKEALLTPEQPRRSTLRRSWPWFGFALVLVALTFLPSFIVLPPSGRRLLRGTPYFVYVVLELLAYATILIESVRQMRRAAGLRRIEGQFLVLNMATSSFVAAALNGIGSYTHHTELKAFAFVVSLGTLALMGWAMTVHRVFDLRQLFVSGARSCATASIVAVVVVCAHRFLRLENEAAAYLLLACVMTAAIWAHGKIVASLGVDGRNGLRRLRQQVTEITRTHVTTDDLVSAFEMLLGEECRTNHVTLTSSPAEAAWLGSLARNPSAFSSLCAMGWATPETLARRQRRDPALTGLSAFLDENRIGLLIAVPAGNPPSLVVALGIKSDGGSYTYPEIERLINLAELMDNVVARTRLTTEAALQAKREHLAMMSRGLAHDLKNLITPIDSFLVYTRRWLQPETKLPEIHDAAKRSVRAITEYVSDALFLSHPLQPKFELIDFERAKSATIAATIGRAAAGRVTIAFEFASGICLVGDQALLERLLANLVNNAVAAAPNGTAVIAGVEPGVDGAIRIQVRNIGRGVTESDAPPLRDADPDAGGPLHSEPAHGIGLGLAICEKIAALHHGTVSIDTASGQTIVTVDLPATPKASFRVATQQRGHTSLADDQRTCNATR